MLIKTLYPTLSKTENKSVKFGFLIPMSLGVVLWYGEKNDKYGSFAPYVRHNRIDTICSLDLALTLKTYWQYFQFYNNPLKDAFSLFFVLTFYIHIRTNYICFSTGNVLWVQYVRYFSLRLMESKLREII